MQQDHWIFGYGSLIWRPAFPYAEQRPGYIVGYQRRFWQASTDHRGTPEAPGRVVTLLEAPGERCWGRVYRVSAADVAAVLDALDFREQAGYRRLEVDVYTRAETAPIRALVYVATADNPHYLGPMPIEDIARVVQSSHGPSGSNIEYVMRLAEALAEIGAPDPHVSELVSHLSMQEDTHGHRRH